VWYEPAATLYHHEHASQKAGRSLHDENEARNRGLLFARWGRLPSDEHLFRPEPPAPDAGGDAQATLRLLMAAPDLARALETHVGRLDGEFVAFLRGRAAATDDPEAAGALEALADHIAQRFTPAAVSERAVALLEGLLAEPDLAAALRERDHELDEDLLGLVRLNAQTARREQNAELAEALDGLAAYIAGRLAARAPALEPDVGHTDGAAAETLRLLLEADDLPDALAQHAARLDAGLLALVRANAAAAGADGDDELAEGLAALAGHIAGRLAEPVALA
jgi:hypothetical protein